ncbi:hypothetical protein ACFFX0_18020 [Citricoccus parietis]|uniref:Secreted protein n=1 Tax=Citricoccus parietis TaxID=592307 RepID=A0ABV5G228_9MICC
MVAGFGRWGAQWSRGHGPSLVVTWIHARGGCQLARPSCRTGNQRRTIRWFAITAASVSPSSRASIAVRTSKGESSGHTSRASPP